jgi:oligopeptide/dipeptide ABC transporter ATP-binding protein
MILVKTENLKKLFPVRAGFLDSILRRRVEKFVHATDGVSFHIEVGETLGLVGESGCGKTTLGLLLALLETPTEGSITFKGTNLSMLRGKTLKAFRRKVQMVFQNPYETLNPRYRICDTLSEPLKLHRIASSKDELVNLVQINLERVGLKPPEEYLLKYPHQLSGGERQRVAIARAMSLSPELMIADEPVSMLDVSIRSGVIETMLGLKKKFNLSCLFITHDLAVARYISDRIAFMYLGKIVELGSTEEILSNPLHPYTELLMSAVPIPDPTIKRNRISIPGEPPSPIDLPSGCRLHPRCPKAKDTCTEKEPELVEVKEGHFVACHLC